MNIREESFIKEIVLSNEVPFNLKTEGLSLLIDAARGDQGIDTFDDLRRRNVANELGLSAAQHNDIQKEVNHNRKIPAIKLIRAFVNENRGGLLFGLKEAKDAIENDRYFRQSQ